MTLYELLTLAFGIPGLIAFIHNYPTYRQSFKNWLSKYKSNSSFKYPYKTTLRKKDSLWFKTVELIMTHWTKTYNRNYSPRKGLFTK